MAKHCPCCGAFLKELDSGSGPEKYECGPCERYLLETKLPKVGP